MSAQLDSVLTELKGVLAAPPATIEGFREAWSRIMDRVVEGVAPVEGARYKPVDVDGVAGTWVTAPRSTDDRLLLFTHGGGYAFGSVHTHRDFAARLADACAARVLGIDYRLAPEHPYPAGVEDTVTTYRRLLADGVPPDRIVLVGDSAGGGIALSALTRIVARGLPKPAGAVAVSAWLDFEALGGSMTTNAGKDPFNQRDVVLMVAAMYVADGSARDAAPLYAELEGLPPLLLHAGGDEVLVDDTRRMAERARAAGVDVTEHIWDGLYHDFPIFDPAETSSEEALSEVAAFVDRVIGRA